MRGPLQRVRVCARVRVRVCMCVCVIGQCHSSDLACRSRRSVRTYGRAGGGREEGRGGLQPKLRGLGDSTEVQTGPPVPSKRAASGARLNEERSHPLWSDPKSLPRRGAEATRRRRGGDAEETRWARMDGNTSEPEITKSHVRIGMNI